MRIALNGMDFDDGTLVDLTTGLATIPTRYLYYQQELRALTPVGGPTGGGTSITVHGRGFTLFDGEASTARCKFDYGGVVSIGAVTSIGSDDELACTVPRASFGGETSVKVALNGLHFVGVVPDAATAGAVTVSTTSTSTTSTSTATAATEMVDGGTVGLSFLYYREPQIFSIVPLSGPSLGSGARVSEERRAEGQGAGGGGGGGKPRGGDVFICLCPLPPVPYPAFLTHPLEPAQGMRQTTFVITLHGRGFDRLAARSTIPSRCRFGGVASDAASVSATYALCLMPPGTPGPALVEFSVNGQDYISQRDEVWP